MTSPNRFLVVVRAGDGSLHPHWTSQLATRNWDLVVSYYGDDPVRYRNNGERRVDTKGLKWPGLYDFFMTDEAWRRYDYIWLPDDDLAVEQDAVAEFFDIVSQLRLPLAQPALSWQSYYSHRVTIRHPSFRVRLTDFVEIMAPCFERGFLEACLPTFRESHSGWGLDWMWPRLLPDNDRRCGVIDAVEMTHTRPLGGPTYAKLREMNINPRTEVKTIMKRLGIRLDTSPQVLGAIDSLGNVLDASRPDEALVLDEQMTHDWAAFKAARSHPWGSSLPWFTSRPASTD
jgi:hypothetical protein